MGVYARFDDVIHGTAAWDLGESCTVCRNTGWVQYPVTMHESEDDACPHGCMDASELIQLDEDEVPALHRAQWDALQPTPLIDFEPDDVDTLRAAQRPSNWGDPLFILESKFRLRGIKRHIAPHRSVKGQVSSDYPVRGLIVDGDKVHYATVPAYLIGRPVDVTETTTTVRYEYFGSSVEIRFSKEESRKLRFAYPWDNDMSSAGLMD